MPRGAARDGAKGGVAAASGLVGTLLTSQRLTRLVTSTPGRCPACVDVSAAAVVAAEVSDDRERDALCGI